MDDGGPAFPHQDSGDTGTRSGMTLRDWFAGQAPVPLGDAARVCGWPPEFNLTTDSERATLWAVMAMLRYEYADAMLVERSIKGDDNG